MTDQIKPASDSRVELIRRLTQGPPPMPRDGEILELIARIDELKAISATERELRLSYESSVINLARFARAPITPNFNLPISGAAVDVRDILARLFGFEILATQQIDSHKATIAQMHDKIAEKDKRIAELEDSVADTTRTLLKNTVTIHDLRGRIAELESDVALHKRAGQLAEERVSELVRASRRVEELEAQVERQRADVRAANLALYAETKKSGL